MRRIKLTIAYDGTNYCGWQVQPNGITIEEVLNKALKKLTGEDILVIGASRTDSGVHAMGNVAVFDTETTIPAEKIAVVLNQRLPEDIVIVKSEEVAADFHPRYCDCSKTYEYHIINTRVPVPTKRLTNYFVSYVLDIEKMRKAQENGTLDFDAFEDILSEQPETKKEDDYLARIRDEYFPDLMKKDVEEKLEELIEQYFHRMRMEY